MTVEIFFIGLGQTGVSIGMALGETELDITRVGYDSERQLARRAQELGAVDKLVSHPRKTPKTADIVILDTPTIDVKDYLEMLGKRLKPEGVVVDTTPLKTSTISWADTYLPEDRYYVGATPIVGPRVLLDETDDRDQPRADLFRDSLVAIVIPKRTREEATTLALNLTHLIGAIPFFVDPVELDGMNATIDGLPRLLAIALMHTASSSPGWRETQRLAGLMFSDATELGASLPPDIMGSTLAINKDNLVLKLEALIQELHNLQLLITENNGETLTEYCSEAMKARDAWLNNRARGERFGQEATPLDISERETTISRLLGFRIPKPRERQ